MASAGPDTCSAMACSRRNSLKSLVSWISHLVFGGLSMFWVVVLGKNRPWQHRPALLPRRENEAYPADLEVSLL